MRKENGTVNDTDRSTNNISAPEGVAGMTTPKPLRHTSNDPSRYLLNAVVLIAAAIRIPPLLIEQITPVVLGSLVRLRMLRVFTRELTDRTPGQLTQQRRLMAAVKPERRTPGNDMGVA